jgi:hypothetical protein
LIFNIVPSLLYLRFISQALDAAGGHLVRHQLKQLQVVIELLSLAITSDSYSNSSPQTATIAISVINARLPAAA